MFHYEEPKFKKKRVLRIEMLEQLRDYPRNYWNISFNGYSDGIVCGCEVSWDSNRLMIEPGILYYRKKLYFMEQPYYLECVSEDRMRYLKVQFLAEIQEEGKIEGNTRILLEEKKPDVSCEIELCRFRLQEGARLRNTYENLEDYTTEYDTIHLVYVPYASYQESTLHPKILKQFAQEMLSLRSEDSYDISFVMNVMANQGKIPADCIRSYLEVKLGKQNLKKGNEGLYEGLKEVLREQKLGKPRRKEQEEGKRRVMLL